MARIWKMSWNPRHTVEMGGCPRWLHIGPPSHSIDRLVGTYMLSGGIAHANVALHNITDVI